ncbi:hypothetical protein FCV25MIE_14382 [Fagus crenata]
MDATKQSHSRHDSLDPFFFAPTPVQSGPAPSSNPNGKIVIPKAHGEKCYFMLSFNSRVGLRRILQNWTLEGKADTSKLVTSKHQCECVLSTRFELLGQQKKEDLWPRRDCPRVLVWEACELEYTILLTGQRMTRAQQVEKFMM